MVDEDWKPKKQKWSAWQDIGLASSDERRRVCCWLLLPRGTCNCASCELAAEEPSRLNLGSARSVPVHRTAARDERGRALSRTD